MFYLIAHYWFPMLLALVVGVVGGYVSVDCRAQSKLPSWVKLVVVLFILGVIVAWLDWVPDAPGLWWETAVLLTAAWLVGLWLGVWLGKCKCSKRKPMAPAVSTVTTAQVSDGDYAGVRPVGLVAPENNQADVLERINGIGPKNEKILNSLGIYHFKQIASWTPDNVEWVNSYMAFPGRIEREDWIGQAKHILRDPSFQLTPASVKRGESH